MNNSRNYILIPVIAIIPCFIYTLLYSFGVLQPYSISIALALAVIGDQINRRILKNSLYNKVFALFIVSLIITLLSWLLTYKYIRNHNFCFIIFEINTVIFFMLLRINRTLINLRYVRRSDISQKLLYQGFIQVASLINYFFITHISIVLIYVYIRDGGMVLKIGMWDTIIFRGIPFVAVMLVVAYELWRVRFLMKKLNKEEWLPIVSEDGDITGKIAKSISLKMKDKYRHPVVRIALICGEKVFIQERPIKDHVFPGKLDYPFEKYVLYGHIMRESVTNSIKRNLEQNVMLDVDYIFKYPYENPNTKRLIFFYTARIANESDIKRTKKMSGKFWTIKQIEDAFADNTFSENFELEFEYLKNMILLKDESCLFCTT